MYTMNMANKGKYPKISNSGRGQHFPDKQLNRHIVLTTERTNMIKQLPRTIHGKNAITLT